jgi:hypothetical protein
VPSLLEQFLCGLRFFVPYVAYISALLSLTALAVVLWDRRPRLTLSAKKGRWITVSKSVPDGWLLEGVIEAYNLSSRANTIRGYSLGMKDAGGNWVPLEWEQYALKKKSTRDDKPLETERTMNQTPLIVAPYSGVEVPFAAFTGPGIIPREVKVEIMDLFGKRYSLEAPVVRD